MISFSNQDETNKSIESFRDSIGHKYKLISKLKLLSFN